MEALLLGLGLGHPGSCLYGRACLPGKARRAPRCRICRPPGTWLREPGPIPARCLVEGQPELLGAVAALGYAALHALLPPL